MDTYGELGERSVITDDETEVVFPAAQRVLKIADHTRGRSDRRCDGKARTGCRCKPGKSRPDAFRVREDSNVDGGVDVI